MFQLNEVYEPTRPIWISNHPVRVVDVIFFRSVILIKIDEETLTAPFKVNYDEWTDLLENNVFRKITDPYVSLSSIPPHLPPAARQRIKTLTCLTEIIGNAPELLHSSSKLSKRLTEIAPLLELNPRTLKRWTYEWLRSGRNIVSVVRKFTNGSTQSKQTSGRKRGRCALLAESSSNAPAHEVSEKILHAYNVYIVRRGMTWRDAYFEMLIELYQLPEEAMNKNKKGFFLDPHLIEKYRAPTWGQFRHRCRETKKAFLYIEQELPLGSRGVAHDVPGPGFFEIDATGFQIQLVSRVSKDKLVGRPTVYLIVDVYDGVITGYAVTLESPSWAVAALALYNCFMDKGKIFKRLDLPFKSEDWPCHHLPTVLRADRAELVSNMGQNFPSSGIRVEITPSMTPESKGTVEGKNAEIKNPQQGRFDLPGRFEKMRKRRSPDGKKEAALNLFEFEKILVEIIMDLNGKPIQSKRIPPDALGFGAKIASRIGFHEWALSHRSGFTRSVPPNFLYEHLLTQAKGSVTPLGIKAQGEIYNCDRLRDIEYLGLSVTQRIKINISYNPLNATEIYFFDKENGQWTPAYNIDPEVNRLRMSMPEVRDFRNLQRRLAEQAALNNHAARKSRAPSVRQAIKKAIADKESFFARTSRSNANLRENRADEKALERNLVNNNLSIEPYIANQYSKDDSDTVIQPSTNDGLALWRKVDAINRN